MKLNNFKKKVQQIKLEILLSLMLGVRLENSCLDKSTLFFNPSSSHSLFSRKNHPYCNNQLYPPLSWLPVDTVITFRLTSKPTRLKGNIVGHSWEFSHSRHVRFLSQFDHQSKWKSTTCGEQKGKKKGKCRFRRPIIYP